MRDAQATCLILCSVSFVCMGSFAHKCVCTPYPCTTYIGQKGQQMPWNQLNGEPPPYCAGNQTLVLWKSNVLLTSENSTQPQGNHFITHTIPKKQDKFTCGLCRTHSSSNKYQEPFGLKRLIRRSCRGPMLSSQRPQCLLTICTPVPGTCHPLLASTGTAPTQCT